MKVIKMEAAYINPTNTGTVVRKIHRTLEEHLGRLRGGYARSIESLYTDVVIQIDDAGITTIKAKQKDFFHPFAYQSWEYNFAKVREMGAMPIEWLMEDFTKKVDISKINTTKATVSSLFGLVKNEVDAIPLNFYDTGKYKDFKATYTCGVKIYE